MCATRDAISNGSILPTSMDSTSGMLLNKNVCTSIIETLKLFLSTGITDNVMNLQSSINLFNTSGIYGSNPSQLNATVIFKTLVKFISNFLINILQIDVGFGMNIMGYFYKTKEYYTNLTKKYIPFYADRWIALALNMPKIIISSSDVRTPDYFISNFST